MAKTRVIAVRHSRGIKPGGEDQTSSRPARADSSRACLHERNPKAAAGRRTTRYPRPSPGTQYRSSRARDRAPRFRSWASGGSWATMPLGCPYRGAIGAGAANASIVISRAVARGRDARSRAAACPGRGSGPSAGMARVGVPPTARRPEAGSRSRHDRRLLKRRPAVQHWARSSRPTDPCPMPIPVRILPTQATRPPTSSRSCDAPV